MQNSTKERLFVHTDPFKRNTQMSSLQKGQIELDILLQRKIQVPPRKQGSIDAVTKKRLLDKVQSSLNKTG